MALTQKDFDQIEKLLDEKLNEKLKILPTKEEFTVSEVWNLFCNTVLFHL
jgi:hypothetical protein